MELAEWQLIYGSLCLGGAAWAFMSIINSEPYRGRRIDNVITGWCVTILSYVLIAI